MCLATFTTCSSSQSCKSKRTLRLHSLEGESITLSKTNNGNFSSTGGPNRYSQTEFCQNISSHPNQTPFWWIHWQIHLYSLTSRYKVEYHQLHYLTCIRFHADVKYERRACQIPRVCTGLELWVRSLLWHPHCLRSSTEQEGKSLQYSTSDCQPLQLVQMDTTADDIKSHWKTKEHKNGLTKPIPASPKIINKFI